MAVFQTFDVVVVPFPYSDRLAEKRRPALVVSSPALEDETDLLWVAMITSAGDGQIGSVAIADSAASGLQRRSWVKVSKVATVETSRVIRQVGTLTAIDQGRVKDALGNYLGFGFSDDGDPTASRP